MSIETREGLWGCVCDTGLENLILCSSDQDTIFITVRAVCFFMYYCAIILTKIYTCTIIRPIYGYAASFTIVLTAQVVL